jgi:hypothetical protein
MGILMVVEEIVWLADPNKYRYILEEEAITTKRKGKIGLSRTEKLIGYENHFKKGKGIQTYNRRYWYLRDHDCGMPNELEAYKKDKMPHEAILPSQISVSEDAIIIKEYEITNEVKICSFKGKQKEWEYAKKEGRPLLIIIKSIDYGKIQYNMHPIDFNLKKEAVKLIKTTFEDYYTGFNRKELEKIIPKKTFYYAIGPESGIFPKMRLNECKILANKLKMIIGDENNWEPLVEPGILS